MVLFDDCIDYPGLGKSAFQLREITPEWEWGVESDQIPADVDNNYSPSRIFGVSREVDDGTTGTI